MSQRKFAFLTMSLLMASSTIYANPATYNHVFISYYTPENVQAMVKYAKAVELGGVIMWEFRGDASAESSDSLLGAAVNAFHPTKNHVPMIMGYWSNWNLYTNDAVTRAIPAPAYAVPGSVNAVTGKLVENTDFTEKLEKMNVITYAFLEAQTKTYMDFNSGKVVANPNLNELGTLYFNDPWADLTKDDAFCNNNRICTFVPEIQNKDVNASRMMGNFSAFAKLIHKDANNPLGSLKKIFSVGGYGHDDSFEDAFTYDDHEPYMNNFVNSAAKIINQYKLDGIDLDYENPNMTHAQSLEYVKLVKKLREKLGDSAFISVTVMADPALLNGMSGDGTQGFAKGTLKEISEVADRVNLMTYDMHGAFDYDGKSGRTGFLTNLFMPNQNDIPEGYHPQFSVDAAVDALTQLNIPAKKINVGIPAYGRALAGIPAENGGLFQIIPSTGSIPRGDLDAATCNISLPLSGNACSGSFQYSYIIANMRGKGFVETEHKTIHDNMSVSNGTTAYANTWSVPAVKISHKLEITNTGSGTDLGFAVKIYDSNKSHEFGKSDWLVPGNGFTYTTTSNPATIDIDNLANLTVHWDTGWGADGDCPMKLDFTKSLHVMIRLDNQGKAVCDIKPL